MKVTNHTGPWDSKLAWCSLLATHCNCLNGSEHSLWIHVFRPTWLYLIIKILTTRAKFLQPSIYYELYRGKEKIHIEIELIISLLKWYNPTSIISLALLVLRPKLVLLLTDVPFRAVSVIASFCFCLCLSFILPQYPKSRDTSHNTTLW